LHLLLSKLLHANGIHRRCLDWSLLHHSLLWLLLHHLHLWHHLLLLHRWLLHH